MWRSLFVRQQQRALCVCSPPPCCPLAAARWTIRKHDPEPGLGILRSKGEIFMSNDDKTTTLLVMNNLHMGWKSSHIITVRTVTQLLVSQQLPNTKFYEVLVLKSFPNIVRLTAHIQAQGQSTYTACNWGSLRLLSSLVTAWSCFHSSLLIASHSSVPHRSPLSTVLQSKSYGRETRCKWSYY